MIIGIRDLSGDESIDVSLSESEGIRVSTVDGLLIAEPLNGGCVRTRGGDAVEVN